MKSVASFLARAVVIYILSFGFFMDCCLNGPSYLERGLQRTGTASYLWRFMDKIQLDYELKQRAEKTEAEIEQLQAQMDELRSQKNPSWPRSDGPYFDPKPWIMTNFFYIPTNIINVSAGQ